ncbi:hypothetical protein SPOG_03541 [Schizosaccharomyces cryophilus OY26]|uniref:Uncharacterized protein n=1 Tax=Schizosaccharomyces cryophilus (strain OY26 / ATCC MYA-4695 / CBS 11777 / NBRC 106824 / NRRL Y48691) TaxID=653667 RepID=S9WZC6_SCHCR|nr:uncharacterized protein SPOG_03541 [Schizosaccharomyces cryophilus OY26]EPY50072.1 hypothetical protein SPOG_03541 [Schizosaccharomyces cryophilus OY26]
MNWMESKLACTASCFSHREMSIVNTCTGDVNKQNVTTDYRIEGGYNPFLKTKVAILPVDKDTNYGKVKY